jgi:Holliday junction DNA helicase RuvA
MIGRLTGILVEKNPPQIVARRERRRLRARRADEHLLQPARGRRKGRLHTHLAVREDAHQLFGFATEAERAAFRQLLKISGIGARTALSVLSGLSVGRAAQAVAAAGTGPADEDSRHRQEDRRAAAARTEATA